MPFEHYRKLVADWSAFQRAIGRPENPALRVRTGTISVEDLADRLRTKGYRLTSVPGLPEVLKVEDGPGSVAQTAEHWLGLFHVQQAVMSLPTLALEPRPGERVLDLCAAPGGKTVHLAERMEDRGPLVAVDPKEKRLRGLLGNLYRLGHPNVLVVAADGRTLPESAKFDRVLVDAPCSAQGNVRRQPRLPRRTDGFVEYVTSLQEQLLRRGIRVTRPGGVVVYSTCTFAPEENEAVLDRVLRSEPVRLEPISLPVPHDSGVTEWENARFSPEIVRAWRVYPHHLDSGGLFMARLRRLEDDGSEPPAETDGAPLGPGSTGLPTGWTPVPSAFPGENAGDADERIAVAKGELAERYGMDPELLERLGWLVRKENIWVHTARGWPVNAWTAEAPNARWRVVSLGIRALRRGNRGQETPSSHFLGRWGEALSQERRVEVDDEELRTLLAGERLPKGDLPTGPVALLWEGVVVGRGMVGRQGLGHEIGRSYAERLRTILG